jgi:2-phospho-L-lactate transferase/gluconeogenesis factor (CofD/UPF0052 family)
VELRGIENARVPAEVSEAISRAEAIILCPSNPVVSIGPILAVPGMRELLTNCSVPKVAVSPIVDGRALKGPADRMLRSLGHEVSATGVARMYEGTVDGFAVDRLDGEEEAGISALGMRVLKTDAVMRDGPDREAPGAGGVELLFGASVNIAQSFVPPYAAKGAAAVVSPGDPGTGSRGNSCSWISRHPAGGRPDTLR